MARRNRNARRKIEVMPVDIRASLASVVKKKDEKKAEEYVQPTPEQRQRGYTGDWVMDDNGRKAWAYRNTGHDPVARWLASDKLDQRQKAAIDVVRRLWDIVGIRQKITASYGERVGGGGCVELHAALVLDAMKDLERIEGYFTGLRQWWQVFENVCRFGEPAGATGIALGYAPKTAQTRALTTVQFIADIIADRERI